MRSQHKASLFETCLLIKLGCVIVALMFPASLAAAVPHSGGVTAVKYGHSLFVHGNYQANRIWIYQFSNGNIGVSDLDANGVSARMSRGETNTNEMYVFSDVRNIFVNTFGGNDLVMVTNEPQGLIDCLDFDELKKLGDFYQPDDLDKDFYIAGELEIVTGSGRDTVGVGEVRTGYNLEVFSDSESDDVGFCYIDVGQNLLVITGHGSDDVLIRGFVDRGGADEFANYVRYSATVDSGGEHDRVCIEDLEVDHGSLTVVTSGGHDQVRIGPCLFGDPEGLDAGPVSVAHNLVVDTGWGEDDVFIDGVAVGLNLIAVLGSGWDDMFLEDVFVEQLLHVNAGNEGDDVYVRNVETQWLEFFMGHGNDELIIDWTSAYRILADGGPGNDCLDESNNWFNHEIIYGFESFDCD